MKVITNQGLKIYLMFFIASLAFFSCQKQEQPEAEEYPEVKQGEGVFIINEGNFQWGNSSLSYYNKQSGDNWHNIFSLINGENPGDVLQSGVLHQGNIWLVINNSGKIEVMNPETGERITTISGLTSPRQILPLDNKKAYVSDLYTGGIHILNLENSTVEGLIPVTGWTEAMVNIDEKIIVSGMESGKIYSIDPSTDQITDSLFVGAGPNSMVTDSENMLWILCGGDLIDNSESQLVKVDPDLWQVVQTTELTQRSHPFSKLTIDNQGKRLYFIGGDVYTYEINNTGTIAEMLISGQGMILYGFGIDPENNELYVSDAIDYTQPGKVMRYSAQGQLLDQFLTRIIPGGFIFY